MYNIAHFPHTLNRNNADLGKEFPGGKVSKMFGNSYFFSLTANLSQSLRTPEQFRLHECGETVISNGCRLCFRAQCLSGRSFPLSKQGYYFYLPSFRNLLTEQD